MGTVSLFLVDRVSRGPGLASVSAWKGRWVLGRPLPKGAFDLLATLGNSNWPSSRSH